MRSKRRPEARGQLRCNAVATAARVRGMLPQGLGPEWRRRLGLARVTLGVRERSGVTVAGVRPEHFVPVALPWMISVVPVADHEALRALLRRYRRQLSVVARAPAMGTFLDSTVDRVCALGRMQSPPFPRHHDGQPMFAHVCGWTA